MMLHEKYKTLLDKYGVNTPLRMAHFMSQIEHESGLKPIIENLNYSSIGLIKTFPKYFGEGKTLSFGYANKPEQIANKVYANRMGNGDEQSGDGWKYRGRGFIQITGKETYYHLANDTNIDCFKNPDLLLEESNAMISALWFWKSKAINVFADLDDINRVAKRINGGLNGIEHRKELLLKWKLILK